MRARQPSRPISMLALMIVALALWSLFGDRHGSVAQGNFVGTPPSRLESEDVRVLRLRFEAGSRSNWHSHSHGQLLLVEEGLGRTQVRGDQMTEMRPGQPVYVGPDVEHWHGAAPDQHMIQLTVVSGQARWAGPVSDADYLGR